MQQDHSVGVVLDRARFAEIRQPGLALRPAAILRWAPIVPFLGFAVELRQGKYRDAKVASQEFQAARDGADFLSPAAVTLAGPEELQVVHDNEIQSLAELAPPTPGADRIWREAPAVDDLEGGAVESVACRLHGWPVASLARPSAAVKLSESGGGKLYP